MMKTEEIPGVQNSLGIISNNTNRLIELTNQLLDFRQIEINEFHLSFTKENISKLIYEAVQSFSGLADEKNLKLSLDLPDHSVDAFIDKEAFTKILYNLLSNAVKYGKEQACIELQPYYRSRNTFTILIRNDGFIIPHELHEKIFEPFYRVKETRIEKGTGIGLTLAQSLAKLHKGVLVLEHPENRMNVFSLTLPIYHKQEQPTESYSITTDKIRQ